MASPSDPLFGTRTAYVVVTCWSCKRETRFDRSPQLAAMGAHDFERRARCSGCGSPWPHVLRYQADGDRDRG